jgi:hypothetical protein
MLQYFKKQEINFDVERICKLPDDHGDCFKFAFVRNPWGRIVSTYENKIKLQWENREFAKLPNIKYRIEFYEKFKNCSFSEFIKWMHTNGTMHDQHTYPQSNLLPFNNLNFLGKYEFLETDFEKLCKKIKIEFNGLPHENSSNRDYFKPLHTHYTEYYDEETKSIVAEMYSNDIEYFNYKFGE